MKRVICDYCNHPAPIVTGKEVYPHRPDLFEKRFYLCKPCKAHVGCHPGTDTPLGRLADAKLRSAKKAAHNNFDKLWKSKLMKRHVAYARLSDKLGIPRHKTHIGMFDVEQCLTTVYLVRSGALNQDTRDAIE